MLVLHRTTKDFLPLIATITTQTATLLILNYYTTAYYYYYTLELVLPTGIGKHDKATIGVERNQKSFIFSLHKCLFQLE